MIGLVALDFMLGIVLRGMVDMSLVIEVFRVDRDNGPRHPSSLRIPAYVIADFKSSSHLGESSFDFTMAPQASAAQLAGCASRASYAGVRSGSRWRESPSPARGRRARGHPG